jgi:radical SAM protein with 4Fe4S-binding SPASM domain
MNSKTFCGAPFYSVYIGPDGQFSPCCIFDTLNPITKVGNKEEILEAYNSEEMVNLRKDFLNGLKPEKCHSCWRYEDNDNVAYRNYFNTKLYDENIVKTAIYNDLKINDIKIKHFDIRFSNICNLKCRSCNSNFSSSWYNDEVKLGYKISNSKIKEIKNKESVLDFIFSQLNSVEEIYFAGGEPLMMEEHYKILDKIIEMDRQDYIKIIYSTNFSKLQYGKWDVINQWSKFKRVDVMASLDGSYEKGEYIRKNIVWSEVVENIEKLKSTCNNVTFKLGICVSILNAYNFIELHKEWVEKGYLDVNMVDLNILDQPYHLRVSNLPVNHKKSLKELYENHIEWMLKNYDEELTTHPIKEMIKLLTFLEKDPHPNWERDFFLKEIPVDKIRNEDFFNVFPEYNDLKDKILII